MLAFGLKRLVAAVPLVWGALTVVFLLIEAAPGRSFPLEGGPGFDPRTAGHLRAVFGADRSLPQRYLSWMGDCLTGDLGISHTHRQPVTLLLRRTVGNTLLLGAAAIVLQFVLGVSAGVACRWIRRGWLDRVVAWIAGFLYSLPSFWIGLVLVWVLSVRLGWLPASQMRSLEAPGWPEWKRVLDGLRHILLPCLTLALPAAAGIALFVRGEMERVLERGFIRAARARGLRERAVFLRHGLRNALLPIVQLFGLALPGLVGGSVVVEVLFAWPGMGRLAYQAVLSRDEPLILGCTLVAGLAVLLGNLAADLLAAGLDCRYREGMP